MTNVSATTAEVGPPGFWQIESVTELFLLITFAAVLAALLALLQRHRADARTAWWGTCSVGG